MESESGGLLIRRNQTTTFVAAPDSSRRLAKAENQPDLAETNIMAQLAFLEGDGSQKISPTLRAFTSLTAR